MSKMEMTVTCSGTKRSPSTDQFKPEQFKPEQFKPEQFTAKEPGSALTHFIAFIMAVCLIPPLLIHGINSGLSDVQVVSLVVFIFSMILLYGASTAYHTFRLSDNGCQVLKKIDHMMIFVLIAGSYTPICAIHLADRGGYWLLALVWTIALLGIAFKFFWINCPKWVSSILYIGMGWVCILAWRDILVSLPSLSFNLLLTGGIVYTIGGIIYALKLPFLDGQFKNFGTHELFHLFVMGGSICHYLAIYLSV